MLIRFIDTVGAPEASVVTGAQRTPRGCGSRRGHAYRAAVTDVDNPLGEFLRARRELVDPADHGIRDGGRRRVPGLRREELAFLAGVSAPYYARLEQGTDRSPSRAVLDAIARVLRLDEEGSAYLNRLALPSRGRTRARTQRQESIAPIVQRLIDAWPDQAAVVTGRYRTVLASNGMAIELNPGFAPGRNLVRDTFLDEATRELYPDWRDVALASVAGLRGEAGVDLDDPALTALVGELSLRSEEFRAMWARHDVRAKTTGMKRYRHPVVGDLELDYQTFAINGAVGQTLHVFSATPDVTTSDAMRVLSTRANSGAVLPEAAAGASARPSPGG